jgi:caa(3)-type oxidase subunit IV
MTTMSEQGHVVTTHPNYVKVYAALVVLFIISVLGPTLGVPALTLITAFGIAVVKATMVAAYFMHLNIEKRYIWFLLFIMLTFMVVLFTGVAPDVMKQSGQNWKHTTAIKPPLSQPVH